MVATLGVMTLAWWGLAVVAPAMLAARALRRGREALERRAFNSAERLLQRAARQPRFRAEALGLLAENALRSGRPYEALFALESAAETVPESRRDRLLRGVVCTWLGQGSAAQQILEPLADRPDSTPEEHLAMAHACLVAGDADAAGVFLAMIPPAALAGPLAARARLCAAAIAWRHGRRAEALAALPGASDCTSADARLVARLRTVAAAPRRNPDAPPATRAPQRPTSSPAAPESSRIL